MLTLADSMKRGFAPEPHEANFMSTMVVQARLNLVVCSLLLLTQFLPRLVAGLSQNKMAACASIDRTIWIKLFVRNQVRRHDAIAPLCGILNWFGAFPLYDTVRALSW